MKEGMTGGGGVEEECNNGGRVEREMEEEALKPCRPVNSELSVPPPHNTTCLLTE